MKSFIVFIFLITLFDSESPVFAQGLKDQAYWDKFDEARLYIAKHNAGKSVQILETLHQQDTIDPNVGYLLGVALIITGKDPMRSVALFESADARFSELWDNPGVGPPEHLYYYQILGYCRTQHCDKAQASLQRLEEAFVANPEFLQDDDYYLIDGRKWANLCKEPTVKLLEVPERLVKHDLRIKTEPYKFSTYSTLYGVQVAALLEPQMTRKLEGLKNVEVFVDMHGVYRYVIGNFVFKSQAEKMLQVVRNVGYVDAFIVNITDQERYPLEVVALDQKSPRAQIRGSVDYRIQLAAFKETMPDESARFYLMIDSISELNLQEVTLLTVGNYRSYGNALQRRDELRRMGFKDAFVVAFNEGRKVPLEDARQYLRRVEQAE